MQTEFELRGRRCGQVVLRCGLVRANIALARRNMASTETFVQ